jgi:DNA polymerase III delta prime subunit
MSNKPGDNRPWTNKYAVQSFEDICGQREVVELLEEALSHQQQMLEHIILYGPSGTGKTSLMNCIIERVFGAANFGVDCTRNNRFVLRSNASDERCFDSIESKLLKFVRCGNEECERRGVKRIVALDEVDSMMPEAQSALRSLLTQCRDRVCFIMTCNDIGNNVIRTLQSECMALHVGQVSANDMALMALKIAQREGVRCTQAGIDALLLGANGDVRRMLNDYQAIVSASGNVLDENAVLAISHAPPQVAVLQVLKECIDGRFISAQRLARHLVEAVGYDVSDILTTMYSVVVNDETFAQGDERKLLHFQSALCDTMILSAKQQATTRTLSGLLAKICRHRR